MRVVVDTSVWVDYLKFEVNPETTELHRLLILDPDAVLVLSLVTYELYCGLRTKKERTWLESVVYPTTAVDVGSTGESIDAGDRFAYLRRRGITIRSSIDVLIASYCINEGHQLLARDRDFDHFEKHFGLVRYSLPSAA